MFINDGSKDKSLDYIKDFCRKDEDFLFISLDSNYGLSTGLKAGIDNTFSRLVAYIDADLQTYPEDFELRIPYVNDGYDLAMGIRADRKDTLLKKFCSKCANNIRRALLNDDIKDTGCPLKIIRTETAKKMPFFKADKDFVASFQNDINLINDYVEAQIGLLSDTLKSADALYGPSKFMDLIHNAQLAATGADISFAGVLSTDAVIPTGKLTMRNLFTLYKYENLLYTMSLSGTEIKDFLEYGYGTQYNQMKSENDHLLTFKKVENGKQIGRASCRESVCL